MSISQRRFFARMGSAVLSISCSVVEFRLVEKSERQHLVVELKRPKVVVGRKSLARSKSMRLAVAKR